MGHHASIYATTHPVTHRDLTRHLAASSPVVTAYVEHIHCRVLPGDRIDLVDLWQRMWGIDQIPIAMVPAMQRPLVTVEYLAELVNTTSHTIRRAGNNFNPKWNLPDHVDLGPRVRRYLPLHVNAWIHRLELEPWLRRRRGPKGPLGLTARTVLPEVRRPE